ncbi:hypothetical protein AOA57_30350 [Pseudomonas sp. 2588-5]|nr:hypothetical protein AOA57_30350 [Pseudomonas sp. 2588-5]
MIAVNYIAAIERLRLMESDFRLKWDFYRQPGQSWQETAISGHRQATAVGQKRSVVPTKFWTIQRAT